MSYGSPSWCVSHRTLINQTDHFRTELGSHRHRQCRLSALSLLCYRSRMKDTTTVRACWMLTKDVPLSHPSWCSPQVPGEVYNLTPQQLSPAECSSVRGAWGLIYRSTEHFGRQAKSGRGAPGKPRAIPLLISAGPNSDQLLCSLPDLHLSRKHRGRREQRKDGHLKIQCVQSAISIQRHPIELGEGTIRGCFSTEPWARNQGNRVHLP